jgi:hypothetical protein
MTPQNSDVGLGELPLHEVHGALLEVEFFGRVLAKVGGDEVRVAGDVPGGGLELGGDELEEGGLTLGGRLERGARKGEGKGEEERGKKIKGGK